MSELKPSVAAMLASRIYQIQNEDLVDLFLMLPIFKQANNKIRVNPSHRLVADVGGRLILNYQDGFGVCAEGGSENEDELFLVFRGTTTANKNADVLTDARIGITTSMSGLPVHVGFNHCFNSMADQLRSFINQYAGKNIKVIHCVGHSLGGAVASLAADWVSREYGFPVKLYSFGAPRTGTDWFVKSTTTSIGRENIHRVYHKTDPVPMVPLYPFMHAPYNDYAHYLNSSYPLTSGTAHSISKYIESIESNKIQSWSCFVEQPSQPCNIESAVEKWLKSSSPVDASSPIFWQWVDSALIYVIKKIAMGAILSLQSVFIGGFTIADKIAYILVKGIELAENISVWVERLMRKIMQALGMAVVKSKNELTRALMRHVLRKMSEKANREARKALNKL